MADYQAVGGEVIAKTPLAVLIRLEDGQSVWVPRSQIEGGDELDVGDEDLSIATWWLREQGLEQA